MISSLRRRYGLRDRNAVYQGHRVLLAALQRRDAPEAVRIAQQACEDSKLDLIAKLQSATAVAV